MAQGYHLVRVIQEAGSPSLWLLEPSVQPEKIIQATRSVGRLHVEKNTFQSGLEIDATNEPQILQFLKTLTGTPGLAASTLSSVNGIPAELTRQAYDAAGNSFSHIGHRDFSDLERGAHNATSPLVEVVLLKQESKQQFLQRVVPTYRHAMASELMTREIFYTVWHAMSFAQRTEAIQLYEKFVISNFYGTYDTTLPARFSLVGGRLYQSKLKCDFLQKTDCIFFSQK